MYNDPVRKVFLDPHNDFYGKYFVRAYLTVMRAQPGWKTSRTLWNHWCDGPTRQPDKCGTG